MSRLVWWGAGLTALIVLGAQLVVDARIRSGLRELGTVTDARRSWLPGALRIGELRVARGEHRLEVHDATVTSRFVRRSCDGSPTVWPGVRFEAERLATSTGGGQASDVCLDLALGLPSLALRDARLELADVEVGGDCRVSLTAVRAELAGGEHLRLRADLAPLPGCAAPEGLPPMGSLRAELTVGGAALVGGAERGARLPPAADGDSQRLARSILEVASVLAEADTRIDLEAGAEGGQPLSACVVKRGRAADSSFELSVGMPRDQLAGFGEETRRLLDEIVVPAAACGGGGGRDGLRWRLDLTEVELGGRRLDERPRGVTLGQPIARYPCGEAAPASCGYRLAFVEFGDDGRLLDRRQVDELVGLVEGTAAGSGALVSVLMHGWQHSGQPGDDNIARFRELVEATAVMEAQSKGGVASRQRAVVGVYLAWRGSLYGSQLANSVTTFWNRLAVADRLGRDGGDLQRTLERLAQATAESSAGRRRPSDRSALIVAGHSMGARAIFGATRRALEADRASPGQAPYLGDLVLLINPAFSAEQYQDLHQASRGLAGASAPLVLLASVADRVTQTVYPVGAAFSFEAGGPTDFGRFVTTAANYDRFITHRLRLAPLEGDRESIRRSGQTITRGVERVPPAARAARELFNYRAATVYRDREPWYRMVLCEHDWRTESRELECAGPATPAPDLPAAMVVQVDASIIPSHGDFFTAPFMEYVVRLVNFRLDRRG